jgi:hypothetical protein
MGVVESVGRMAVASPVGIRVGMRWKVVGNRIQLAHRHDLGALCSENQAGIIASIVRQTLVSAWIAPDAMGLQLGICPVVR